MPPTIVKERFQITIADPALKLLDQEAALVSMDRASFARALVGRAMGKLPLERPTQAPQRDAIPYPKKKRGSKTGKAKDTVRMPTTKIVLGFSGDQCEWLRRTAWSLGAMPYSTLFTYLLLDWCNINVLTARDDGAAAA